MSHPKKRTLWELTAGQRLRYSAAILALGLSNAFLFGVPLVAKTAIDSILGGAAEAGAGFAAFFEPVVRAATTERALFQAAGVVVVLTVFAGLFQYLRGRWASTASEAIVRGLRDRLYTHLEGLPCRYHDRADTGDLVQRCTSDVETIRVFLSGQVVEIGRAALLLLMALPVMWSLDPWLTLVSMVLFPPIIAFAVIFFRKVRELFLKSDEAEGAMTAVLQENLTGIRVVRAFARQEFEMEKFAVKNADFRDRTNRLIEVLAHYWAVSDFLCIGQIAIMLIGGCYWMIQGELSVGTLFAFLTLENLVIWPVRHMGRVLADTGKAMVALGRLREILEEREEWEGDETESEQSLPPALSGAIEIDGLTFAFEDGEPALSDVSLNVAPGQTLALIGAPGSGKSALVQLLLRLYDYEEGSIRLDGRELTTLPRRYVRSQIGVVLQEPFLYSQTLGANVRVGRREATQEEIVESTSAAAIHEAIEEFEHGYDTLVGERGVTLSGGQRQRVAIARALVKEPAILVLDDALSAVDTKTEAHILEALRRRRGRRTTILISHRLSSVVHADQILVLEDGAVVQSGTHGRLIAEDGPYRRLWNIQGALEEEMERDLVLSEEEGS